MKYKVEVATVASGYPDYDIIEADYVQYPMGMLVFKKRKADPNSYPEIVKMYAPGWLTVTIVE